MPETFSYPGCPRPVWVLHARYQKNGRDALQLQSAEGPEFCLTVNIPNYELPEGQLLIKVSSENTQALKWAVAHGIIIDTGVNVPTGSAAARLVRKGPHFPHGKSPAEPTWQKAKNCDRWELRGSSDAKPLATIERVGISYVLRGALNKELSKNSSLALAKMRGWAHLHDNNGQ